MGYTTEFKGRFNLDKRLLDSHRLYLLMFSATRHMKRNPLWLKGLPDPAREAVGLPIGPQGAYFTGVGRTGLLFMDDEDYSILDHNQPPVSQPGLWCQWIPAPDGEGIEWDGSEKFYHYRSWLKYLVVNFLKPWGYVLEGSVAWQGEDEADKGVLKVVNNKITTG